MSESEIEVRALLQEHQILCGEILNIQQSQRRLVFSSVLSSGAIIPFAAFYIRTYGEQAGGTADHLVIGIGMVLAALLLIAFCLYIGYYVFIFRISVYIRTHISPRINLLAGTNIDSERLLYWEDYLATRFRPKRLAWAGFLLIALAEAAGLFLILLVYNLLWIYTYIELIGENPTKWHWSFVIFQLLVIAGLFFLSLSVVRDAKGKLRG